MSVSAHKGTRTFTILVVEDEFLIRLDIASSLRGAGYIVLETDNGEDAVALCCSGMPIHILITDINLSRSVNGWEVAERFRKERPDVAVVYTSGKMIDPERCVSGSVAVAKPYQHSDIISACRQLCAE